jgi:hypothetical protein
VPGIKIKYVKLHCCISGVTSQHENSFNLGQGSFKKLTNNSEETCVHTLWNINELSRKVDDRDYASD